MEEKELLITESGLEELKKEYDDLVHIKRAEVIEELKAARSLGDLSENAEYDAARDKQAKIEARINELSYRIKNAKIITESKSTKFVKPGSSVTILELDTNEEKVYKIVGSDEANPFNGKISTTCKLAEAIIDHKVGEVCTVDADPNYSVKIIAINQDSKKKKQ